MYYFHFKLISGHREVVLLPYQQWCKLKTANLSAYNKIFSTTSGVVMKEHKGLLVSVYLNGVITVTNRDGTTLTLNFPTTQMIVLPGRISKWTGVAGSAYVYGLL